MANIDNSKLVTKPNIITQRSAYLGFSPNSDNSATQLGSKSLQVMSTGHCICKNRDAQAVYMPISTCPAQIASGVNMTYRQPSAANSPRSQCWHQHQSALAAYEGTGVLPSILSTVLLPSAEDFEQASLHCWVDNLGPQMLATLPSLLCSAGQKAIDLRSGHPRLHSYILQC